MHLIFCWVPLYWASTLCRAFPESISTANGDAIFPLFLYGNYFLQNTNSKIRFLESLRGGGTIATILFFCIEQLLQQNGGLTRYIAVLLNPVISVLGTYSLVIGILLGCRMCLNSVGKINTDYAMSVYLFHQQLIYFSIHLFNKPWISPFGLTMINFGVGLVGGIVIKYWSVRELQHYYLELHNSVIKNAKLYKKSPWPL